MVAELSERDVAVYFDDGGTLLPDKVGNVPLHPELTIRDVLFASSRGTDFTIAGSLYLTAGRRIRLMHAEGPKLRGPQPNIRRYCVSAHGRAYFQELSKEVGDIEADLKALGALQPAGIGTPGTLLEFWDGEPWQPCSHLSRGCPIAVSLTQRQLNLLIIGAVVKDRAALKLCWENAGLT